jgi:hypothetical protein
MQSTQENSNYKVKFALLAALLVAVVILSIFHVSGLLPRPGYESRAYLFLQRVF